MNQYDTVSMTHPELNIRKKKIFEQFDINKRKTKIICTIGLYFFNLVLPAAQLKCLSKCWMPE